MEYLPIPFRFFHTVEDRVGVIMGFGSGARVSHAVPADAAVVVGSGGLTLSNDGTDRFSVTPTEAEAVDAAWEYTIISAQRGLASSHTRLVVKLVSVSTDGTAEDNEDFAALGVEEGKLRAGGWFGLLQDRAGDYGPAPASR